MNEQVVRVEFALPPSKKPLAPKPAPEFKAERLRRLRAAKRARQLALAYWIDGLVRAGQVADLAAVARLCRVSRTRVSKLLEALGMPTPAQEALLSSPLDPGTPARPGAH